MTDKQTQSMADKSNMEKDPKDWVTGDEAMTGAQRSYLKTLSEEAKEPFDDQLSKADASRRIDELQARTGRGGSGKSSQQHAGTSGEEPQNEGEQEGRQNAQQEQQAEAAVRQDVKRAEQQPEATEVEQATVTSGYTGA
jgi:hypothetical protein